MFAIAYLLTQNMLLCRFIHFQHQRSHRSCIRLHKCDFQSFHTISQKFQCHFMCGDSFHDIMGEVASSIRSSQNHLKTSRSITQLKESTHKVLGHFSISCQTRALSDSKTGDLVSQNKAHSWSKNTIKRLCIKFQAIRTPFNPKCQSGILLAIKLALLV